MINIKVSLPGEDSSATFKNFIDENNKNLQKVKFHINTDIPEADFWFVFEDLYKPQESCILNENKVIYLNSETSYKNSHFLDKYMKEYLLQFSLKYGCYETFDNNYFNTKPFLPWMLNYVSGGSIFSNDGMDVKKLRNLENIEKKKNLSIICSNKVQTDNHKLRYEFAKNLKKYFGDEIDWFGSGVNPINTKSEGISNYKYHIVIENGNKNNLISEKLLDAYLGFSFPLYFGAPNISKYFHNNSYEIIDINDFKKSIKTIKDVIENGLYEKNFEYISNSRDLVLGDYNFINRIFQIVEEINKSKVSNEKKHIVLNNVEYFWSKNTSTKQKVKKIISKKLRIN